MKVENVKLIDGWLIVNDDPNSKWDVRFCVCGKNSHRTGKEALILHRQYQLSQLERLSEKARKGCDSPNTPTKGSEVSRNVSSAM